MTRFDQEYAPLVAALRTIQTPTWRLLLIWLFGSRVLHHAKDGEPIMLRRYGGKLYMV